MTTLATTRDLTIGYGAAPSHAIAVRRVSLSICSGEVVGLLGASGSGKSTLGRALLGRLPAGARVLGGSVERLGKAALIPQEPALSLSPFLRAGPQVEHCAVANGAPLAEQAIELLAQLGLDDPQRIYRSYPHQLSGGQRQRVVWAQALVQRPDLLIADEPTTALDPVAQRELAGQVLALARQRHCAVLWISHDRYLLEAIAGRVLEMKQGDLAEMRQ